jgi:8-hydroxy-5-deazaflavin:NADPH oxidoreductase
MKIAIIGHGNVGGALAKVWAKAGHEIRIGVRHSNDDKATFLEQNYSNISQKYIQEAISEAEIILVATPAHVTIDLAKEWGELKGKVIIDTTNAIGKNPAPYLTGYHAFVEICKAEVVKAFNTTGFENMADPKYGDTTADMFVAGDSSEAKKVAIQLAHDAGFETVYDFGGEDKVKALEHFAFAWINLAIMKGNGRNMAFKILKK